MSSPARGAKKRLFTTMGDSPLTKRLCASTLFQSDVLLSHVRLTQALESDDHSGDSHKLKASSSSHGPILAPNDCTKWNEKSVEDRKAILSQVHGVTERFLKEKGVWDQVVQALDRHATTVLALSPQPLHSDAAHEVRKSCLLKQESAFPCRKGLGKRKVTFSPTTEVRLFQPPVEESGDISNYDPSTSNVPNPLEPIQSLDLPTANAPSTSIPEADDMVSKLTPSRILLPATPKPLSVKSAITTSYSYNVEKIRLASKSNLTLSLLMNMDKRGNDINFAQRKSSLPRLSSRQSVSFRKRLDLRTSQDSSKSLPKTSAAPNVSTSPTSTVQVPVWCLDSCTYSLNEENETLEENEGGWMFDPLMLLK